MPEKADFDALIEEARLRDVYIPILVTPDGLIVADRVEGELVKQHQEVSLHMSMAELILLMNRLRAERQGQWLRPLQLAGQRQSDPDGQRDSG